MEVPGRDVTADVDSDDAEPTGDAAPNEPDEGGETTEDAGTTGDDDD